MSLKKSKDINRIQTKKKEKEFTTGKRSKQPNV